MSLFLKTLYPTNNIEIGNELLDAGCNTVLVDLAK